MACDSVRLCCSENDPCQRLLQVQCRDQVGFLFNLSKLLTSRGIDVERAVISTVDGNVDNEFWLRAACSSDFEDITSFCQELGRTILPDKDPQVEQSPSLSREPLAEVSKRLGINADLLSVESFRELASRSGSSDNLAKRASRKKLSEFRYALQLKGINQTGLLAYASLVFFRCGFSIANAEIFTSDGHIKDRFELVAEQENAARILHTHLHIPMQSDSVASLPWGCRRLGSFDKGAMRGSGFPNFATSSMLAFASNVEADEYVEYDNGDSFQGSFRSTDNSKRRDGYGIYQYRSGDQYKGEWQQDKKHGHGIMLHRDGGAYVGQWCENQKHGLGVIFESVGESIHWYQGEWENDEKHGLGLEERGHVLLFGEFSKAETINHQDSRDVRMRRPNAESDSEAKYPMKRGMKVERVAGVAGVAALTEDGWQPLLHLLQDHAHAQSRMTSRSLPVFPTSQRRESFPQLRMDHVRSQMSSTSFSPVSSGSPRRRSSETMRSAMSVGRMAGPSPRSESPVRRHGSMTPPSFPTAEDTPSSSMMRSRTPDSRAPDLQAIKCPMLWGPNELSIYVSCLGMNKEIIDAVRNFPFRGAAHMIDVVADPEKSEDLGFTSPLQRLLVRRGLQRLLEHDRWENSARECARRDVPSDTVLSAHIVPWEEVKITDPIAEGTFGTVYRATFCPSADRFGLRAGVQHTVAVKAIKFESGSQTMLYEFLKEARVIAALSHENICKFLGICAGPHLSQRYIIIELLGCSLYQLIHNRAQARRLKTPTVIGLAMGIAAGVAYLHSRKVVHADLKSLNILIDMSGRAPVPRICDFGHAAVRATPSPHSRLCTYHWAAPEVLRYESLGPRADVFSCGVIMWEMLTRSIPHADYSSSQVQACVGWAGLIPELEMLEGYPLRLRSILWQCFQFYPKKRPTSRKLHSLLVDLSDDVAGDALRDVEDFLGQSEDANEPREDMEARSPGCLDGMKSWFL